MSGIREIFSEGYPGHYTDMQRLADQAAAAPDEVWGQLTRPSAVFADKFATNAMSTGLPDRWVQPVFPEQGTPNSSPQPQLLVVPGGSGGTLKVRAARYQMGPGGGLYTAPSLVADSGDITTAQVTANSSGSTRNDLVYATIQRAVTVTATRPYRSAGGISNQPIDLASDAQVAITILAGTPGAGVPSIPADSSTAWNFPLAVLTIATGYVLGTAITVDKIRQVWTRGGVPQSYLVPIIGGDGITSNTLVSSRLGPMMQAICPIGHSSSGQTKTLIDPNQFDMRQRWVRVQGTRPLLDTSYKTGEAITKGGSDQTASHPGVFDTGWCHTGTDGAFGTPFRVITCSQAAATLADLVLTFWVDSTDGGLYVKLGGGPIATTDYWFVRVEFTGSWKNLML